MDPELCDFCIGEMFGSREPKWYYAARTFDHPFMFRGRPITRSIGEWAACEECSAAIEAGPAAMDRMAEVMRGTPFEPAIPLMLEFWALFRSHRVGGRVSIPASRPRPS